MVSHGMNKSKLPTSVGTPVVVDCGVHFAVGTAPVQMVGGKVNQVIMLNDYEEAVKALGYSDDWEKYDLCMEVYSAFQLYKISPIFVVNVLDPEKHKTEEETKELTPVDNQIKLPLEVIAGTVKVDAKEAETDFTVFYTDENCIVEFVKEQKEQVSVTYRSVDPKQVQKKDIIGGYDVGTHKTTGLELLDSVFPKYRIAPDLVVCPNWAHDPEVAAIMAAKGENINGVFEADAVVDLSTKAEGGAAYYTDPHEPVMLLAAGETG